jgi:hypothetical protein
MFIVRFGKYSLNRFLEHFIYFSRHWTPILCGTLENKESHFARKQKEIGYPMHYK